MAPNSLDNNITVLAYTETFRLWIFVRIRGRDDPLMFGPLTDAVGYHFWYRNDAVELPVKSDREGARLQASWPLRRQRTDDPATETTMMLPIQKWLER